MSVIFRTLIAFCGIGAGGIAPLAYMVTRGFNSSSSEAPLKTLGNQTSWECRIKGFDDMDLKWVFYNAPFFKKFHCYKDAQYDWQIFLPTSLFKTINIDESKPLNLISEQRENNISPIKIFQESKALLENWLLMKHIKSYNVSEKTEETFKYSGLYEFALMNDERKGERAWVML